MKLLRSNKHSPFFAFHVLGDKAISLLRYWETLDGSAMLPIEEDFVGVSTLPSLDFGSSNYTLSAWIKTKRGGTIVSKTAGVWGAQAKSFYVEPVSSGGKACFAFGKHILKTKRNVADNEWHHVGIIFDNKQGRFFVDDLQSGSHPVPTLKPDPKTLFIMFGYTSMTFPKTKFFDGEIASVTYWPSVLSQGNIREMATLPPGKSSVWLALFFLD
jgi:hypothetical protein